MLKIKAGAELWKTLVMQENFKCSQGTSFELVILFSWSQTPVCSPKAY